MNLLYLSPHFPAQFSLFVERLAQRGVRVYGISDQRDDQLSMSLREALSAHYRVDSLENHEQVFSACDFFIQNRGAFDRVESHLEPWLMLEALIREKYNLKGFKPADLAFIKQKSLMKNLFDKAKVPVARGAIVENKEQCLSFINKKYPVFIKPDVGVGASDTYTIRSEDDLKSFFSVKRDYDYFMEEYLTGVIQSFDGLADYDGKVVFYASHVFSNDIHKIVSHNENLSYYSQREIPADIIDAGMRVVQAAGVKEKFFHIEFFRLPDGTLRALEINMRVPGGLTSHMFNYACDVDVYDWWARIMAGLPSEAPYSRPYHACFIGRKYNRSYAYSHDDILARFGYRVVLSQPCYPIEFDVMGSYGYLVRSPNLEEINEMVDFIKKEG